jgi:hypothetical protein
MKIIFLDIDGVLNNELWFIKSMEAKTIFDTRESRWFCPDNMKFLNYLVGKTGAKVVVSSSWRKSRTVDELKTLLKSNGFEGEVIDKTPVLYFKNKDYPYSVPRGCEIKAWLEINKGILGQKMSKTKYIILDDDSDMLYWQRTNYFRIDPYVGLTNNVAYRAVRFLNSED